jgi:hypothetical protein
VQMWKREFGKEADSDELSATKASMTEKVNWIYRKDEDLYKSVSTVFKPDKDWPPVDWQVDRYVDTAFLTDKIICEIAQDLNLIAHYYTKPAEPAAAMGGGRRARAGRHPQ